MQQKNHGGKSALDCAKGYPEIEQPLFKAQAKLMPKLPEIFRVWEDARLANSALAEEQQKLAQCHALLADCVSVVAKQKKGFSALFGPGLSDDMVAIKRIVEQLSRNQIWSVKELVYDLNEIKLRDPAGPLALRIAFIEQQCAAESALAPSAATVQTQNRAAETAAALRCAL